MPQSPFREPLSRAAAGQIRLLDLRRNNGRYVPTRLKDAVAGKGNRATERGYDKPAIATVKVVQRLREERHTAFTRIPMLVLARMSTGTFGSRIAAPDVVFRKET